MRFPSSRGRYRAGCGMEGCLSGADPRSSKLETEIFYLLAFVLGGGTQDVRFPWDGRMRIDMVFELRSGFRLAVEYDGAYWHQGKENSDGIKSERLVDTGFVHAIVRLREAPLKPLSRLDLVISSGASGRVAAQLALLHLLHTLDGQLASREEEIRIFLESAAEPLGVSDITCSRCLATAPLRAIGAQRRPKRTSNATKRPSTSPG